MPTTLKTSFGSKFRNKISGKPKPKIKTKTIATIMLNIITCL